MCETKLDAVSEGHCQSTEYRCWREVTNQVRKLTSHRAIMVTPWGELPAPFYPSSENSDC